MIFFRQKPLDAPSADASQNIDPHISALTAE
jgi:hypothetical protein